MSEPLSTDPYKGVRDFYPDDWAKMDALFSRIRATLLSWGYEEYNASPLERSELYEAKTSEEIVNEQTYTFTDRGERRVTLRPEMTPTLARMVAAKHRELPMPLRWFSIPNLFRYERPQKGRLREHYQVNVDLLGVSNLEADIEIVRLASSILKSFGAKDTDFVIKVNSRGMLSAAYVAAGVSEDDARAHLRLLDKKAKMPPEMFEIESRKITDKNPLDLIDTKEIESFVATLVDRGVKNAVFDPTLTRGFDYYTGMVFEVFDANPENSRSLFGGGRYDNLIGQLSGKKVHIPAVGFGMGDVTLADFIETHGLSLQVKHHPIEGRKAQLYLGTPRESDVPNAQFLAEKLRDEKARIFVNLTDKSLGDQVKDAVKRGIPYFAAYGADDIAKGTVKLKELLTSTEIEVPFSELSQKIKSDHA